MSLPRTVLATLVLVVASLAITPVTASAADPARYKLYYDLFDRGGAKIPGHSTKWVPQGLAYWSEQDALVISYYDGEKRLYSRLAIIDRNTGVKRKILQLPTKGHVGGIGFTKRYLWVTEDGKVTRVAKSQLGRAEMSMIRSAGTWRAKGSSFMTIAGDKMWLGQFRQSANATTYEYRFAKGGVPVPTGRTLLTPPQVQGMVIHRGKVVWSRSYGRTNDSRIDVRPLTQTLGPAGRSIVAPNMSEGMVIARGELRVVYESGSTTYDGADYRVRTVHRAPIARITG